MRLRQWSVGIMGAACLGIGALAGTAAAKPPDLPLELGVACPADMAMICVDGFVPELLGRLSETFNFYGNERPPHSLTPHEEMLQQTEPLGPAPVNWISASCRQDVH